MKFNVINKLKFKAQAKAPELWFLAGTVLVIAAIHESGKSRVRFERLRDEFRCDMNEQLIVEKRFDEKKDENGLVNGKEYTMAMRRHNHLRLRLGLVKNTAGVYWFTVALAAAGLISYAKAFGILKNRYAGLLAAYMTLSRQNELIEESLKSAASDVVDQVMANGSAADNAAEADSTSVGLYDFLGQHDYVFDERNPNFENDRAKNMFFLNGKLMFLSTQFYEKRGWILKNECLDNLGFPLTQDGQIFGKIHFDNIEDAARYGSSNELSFGLGLDDWKTRRLAQINPNAILIQFNFDKEPIIDKCGWPES